jgi:predicted permease
MKHLRAFLSRLKEPLIRERQDRDLTLELETHLQMLTDDKIRAGIPPEEARRQARIALGGAQCIKENCHDARGSRRLEDLWHDLRYALRTLRRQPGFAAVALLTLALGTGATTVMFTLIDSVLLKPLPYPDPDRLVSVHVRTERFGDSLRFSYPDFLDLNRDSRSLTHIAAWTDGGGTVTEPGEPQYALGREISSGMFSALGIPLFRGRAFLPAEDRPGGPPVIVISYGLWQRLYAGRAAAIGARLVFEGRPYTVVGVMPAGFQMGGQTDVLLPLGQNTLPRMQNRDAHFAQVMARLRPGTTIEQAQAELTVFSQRLDRLYPKSNTGSTFILHPLREDVVGDVRSTLLLLLAAVSLVLLMGCVNVASLLLARAVSRERELAMRVALGAGRSRLVRQCLTESAVLGIFGGLLGVALAAIGIRPFVLLWPDGLPRAGEVQLDWRVLVFALAVALLSALLFGLAPALRAPDHDAEQALRAGGRSVAGTSRRLHNAFVATQIALAVVLLVSAGILGRTLLRLASLDPGFNVRNVLTARAAISPGLFNDPARMRAAWLDLLDRARRVPGITSATLADLIPMREGLNALGYSTTATPPPTTEQPFALSNCVSGDYLRVMGVALRRGRFFDNRDRIDSEPVVVIDEVMAEHAFKGADPVGKRLWISAMGTAPVVVVGVVGHVRHWGLAGDDSSQLRDQFYYPMSQVPDSLMRLFSSVMSIAVRTGVPPMNALEPLRREVRGSTGDQVLYDVHTMEQLASASLARQRFLLLLFGIFAGLALLLACVGIYGVLAYLTSQRVPEIGVRMALGANARDVIRLILRQSIGMIFAGAVVGLAAAIVAARLLERLVAGVQGIDALTIAVMIAILLIAALAASFVPARRASRVDPMRALRQE